MIQFSNKIVIDKSRNKVFSFLTRFENLPLWNYYVLSVSKKSAGDTCNGSIYHQIRRNDKQTFRVTSCRPPELIEIETTEDSKPPFKRRFILTRTGEQIIIEDHFELETKFPTMVTSLSKGRIKNAVLENLNKLKELLENGTTILQDGRSVNI